MRPGDINHMFHNLTYVKSAAEIVTAAKAKVVQLGEKIEERQKRIADLRREYEIDDEAYITLLTSARRHAQQQQTPHQYIYSTNAARTMAATGALLEQRTIGAGVVNNLLTESDFIEAERDEIRTLDLISRNLKDIPRWAETGSPLPPVGFQLMTDELRYLGF